MKLFSCFAASMIFFLMSIASRGQTLAKERGAQARVAGWETCVTLYDKASYQAAIGACNLASNSLVPDMPRLRSMIAENAPQTGDDEMFALDHASAIFQVTYTKARLAAKYGQKQLSHRFALDAAGWVIDLTSILQMNDRSHATPVYKTWSASVLKYLSELQKFDPTAVTEELATHHR